MHNNEVDQLLESNSANDSQAVINVEFAHIYTNQKFSEEHSQGIQELNKHIGALAAEVSLKKVILIDDYSTDVPIDDFDLTEFMNKLIRQDASPDAIILESRLVPVCDLLLEEIESKRLKRGIVSYISTRNKYPCSLFVAAWYLLRLGAFEEIDFETLHGKPSDIYGDNLVTILPKNFIKPEAQAMKLIQSTRFYEYSNKIDIIYF